MNHYLAEILAKDRALAGARAAERRRLMRAAREVNPQPTLFALVVAALRRRRSRAEPSMELVGHVQPLATPGLDVFALPHLNPRVSMTSAEVHVEPEGALAD